MSDIVLIGAGASVGSSSSNMYDLTPVMASYFDVHMVIPLFDHLREVFKVIGHSYHIFDVTIGTDENVS